MWLEVTDLKPSIEDMEVLGYNPKWIDEDFNPKGIRVCFRSTTLENGDGFFHARWNNDQDAWDTLATHPEDVYYSTDDDNVAPTHYMITKFNNTNMNLPDIEIVSAEVHAEWINTKIGQGVTSRKAEDGEELMVPYEQLSEKAKDLDRGTVKAVYRAINALIKQ